MDDSGAVEYYVDGSEGFYGFVYHLFDVFFVGYVGFEESASILSEFGF